MDIKLFFLKGLTMIIKRKFEKRTIKGNETI